MVGQLFSSYHERNAFDEAHAHARLASCLHTSSSLHTQSLFHPNVSMDARTPQEVSRLSFAYALVWAAQQVVRFFVIRDHRESTPFRFNFVWGWPGNAVIR